MAQTSDSMAVDSRANQVRDPEPREDLLYTLPDRLPCDVGAMSS